jgi:hypothetical protein
MNMSEIPKFSETLWWWRSFSKTFDEGLLSIIQELPQKFDRPAKMIDNYVWIPDCSLNIKLREQDLKIKEFLGVQSYYMANALAITTHVERWTTEVYNFPIPVSLMKRIVRDLNLNNMSGLSKVDDKDQFINLLQSHSNSVRVSSIFKQRKQHLLCIDEDLKEKGNKEQGELVTVEISHLTRPKDVFTLSV